MKRKKEKNNKDINKLYMVCWKDHTANASWVEDIKPLYSLLKFRLPYAEKFERDKGLNRKYLDGIVYAQPFCKAASSETRLCVFGKQITERDWDIVEYEEKLFYHNSERRQKHTYKNPIHDEETFIYPEIGLFDDYDSLYFTHVVIEYMTKIGQKINHDSVKKLLKYILYNITGENKLLKSRDC